MIIEVNPHTIEFKQDVDFNAGEYNITTLNFEFSDEYTNLTKMAIFSNCNGTYKTPILNNQCIIPYEVLEEEGQVLLGVYGYEGDEDLTLRYSPTPKYFSVENGSYKEGNDPDLPPKSEWEQLVEEVNTAINETNNLNIEAEKVDHTTTITITHKDGEEQTVEILDGEKGDKGDKGDPGAIKMKIVNFLPEPGEEDTIYLVPIEVPEIGNNYDEYIYTNGQWEKIGGIQVEVDLSDYYTKEETDALIPDLTDYVKNTDYASTSKAGVVKLLQNRGMLISSSGELYPETISYANYSWHNEGTFIGKGTLENVLTARIGDIQTLLDNLNNGNGVA